MIWTQVALVALIDTFRPQYATFGLFDLHGCYFTVIFVLFQMPVVAFHPDGMLIGACGMNSQIYIYDVKSGCDPVVALSGHDTPVTDLQFSENGYYLATASACLGGTVSVFSEKCFPTSLFSLGKALGFAEIV